MRWREVEKGRKGEGTLALEAVANPSSGLLIRYRLKV